MSNFWGRVQTVGDFLIRINSKKYLSLHKLVKKKITMDITKISNLKSKFVSREVGNELILVPLTNNVAQMSELFTLNETAKFIWENITEETTTNNLQSSMIETFDIDTETAKKDIENFLTQMEKLLANK